MIYMRYIICKSNTHYQVISDLRTAATMALELGDAEGLKLAGSACRARAQRFMSRDLGTKTGEVEKKVYRKKAYNFLRG